MKRNLVKLLFVSTLLCVIVTPLFFTGVAVSAQTETGYYYKSYTWDYNGRHWNWNISIPKELYEAYKEVPVSTRTREGPAGYGYLTTTNDYYLRVLAEKLNESAASQNFNSFDQVSFILAFVQSLPYTSDNVTQGYNEYPRFPIETLVDDGGDCEDTSILFASLTLILGYGTVYLNPPNHYAVGILGNDLDGSYFTYNNKTYYYCETTGNNFKIGQIPEEFTGLSAYIYTIDPRVQFAPDIAVTTASEPTPTFSPTYATPTLGPDSTVSPSDTVTEPTMQPAAPISLNLILRNPLFFAFIVVAITMSISLAVWSARRSRETPTPSTQFPSEQTETSLAPADAEESKKFCIFCGSGNKDYAAYCEQCGKQIS